MSARRYLLVYPDGSHTKIKDAQRKEMEREGLLFRVDAHTFRYQGDAFHFRSMAGLGLFKSVISTVKFIGYHPGYFIWEFDDARYKELLESPEKMVLRLKARGQLA